MINKPLTQVPTVCPFCANNLVVNPLFEKSGAKYCPVDGDFFIQRLRGLSPTITFRPFEDRYETYIDVEEKYDPVVPDNPTKPTRSVRIQCEQTGIIYNSIADACHELGLHRGSVTKVLSGERNSAGGYSFVKLAENDEGSSVRRPRLTTFTNGRSIKCDQTGQTFISIADAASTMGIDRSCIRRHLSGELLSLKNGRYTFTSL